MNDTGGRLLELYVKDAWTQTWSKNLLKEAVLELLQVHVEYPFSIPKERLDDDHYSVTWDVKAVQLAGDRRTDLYWRNLNLDGAQELQLMQDGRWRRINEDGSEESGPESAPTPPPPMEDPDDEPGDYDNYGD